MGLTIGDCVHLLRPKSSLHGPMIRALPPGIQGDYDVFHVCEGCGQVYWKGPHYQEMAEFIEQVLGREWDHKGR